jgi:hypothetical protein
MQDDRYYHDEHEEYGRHGRYKESYRKKACVPQWQAQLPADLVPNVLQFVDCKQRLSNCALVARAWKAAAITATKDVEHVLDYDMAFSTVSLVEWLHKHGSKTCSIALAYECHDSAHDLFGSDCTEDDVNIHINLPYKQLAGLRSLSVVKTGPFVDDFNILLLHPTAEQLARMGSSLTSLKLHSVSSTAPQWAGIPGSWRFLSRMTALQQLDLQQDPCEVISTGVGFASQLEEALAGLVGLTQLHLKWQLNENIKLAIG